MSQEFDSRLQLLQQKTGVLTGIGRGIEREALRIDQSGHLSKAPHSIKLGRALTHSTITTDYAESLLEFITPVSENVDQLFNYLGDIHHHVATQLEDEQLWPMSMPCVVGNEDEIILANYGTSNIGQMKTTYRRGLMHRYGSMMQVIAGVHYNFSLPEHFWQSWKQFDGCKLQGKELVSAGYMGLVRNFYRYGWVIPYLFGASPALCSSFLQGKEPGLDFSTLGKGTVYLPHATSLRLSDLGYTNSSQAFLCVSYNCLDSYISSVQSAINTHAPEFSKIGVKVDGEYKQLNANLLQIENELYAPIRPKRVGNSGEKPSEALAARGIEYIEIRSLDVNPLSPLGITKEQVYFLDTFLTWCAVTESAHFDSATCNQYKENLTQVVLSGRDPATSLCIDGKTQGLKNWGEELTEQWIKVADLLDKQNGVNHFSAAVAQFGRWFAEPDKTISAQVLNKLLTENKDNGQLAFELSQQHKSHLTAMGYSEWSAEEFELVRLDSVRQQEEIEASDVKGFDEFLADYFKQ